MLPKTIALQETLTELDYGQKANIYKHLPTGMPIVEIVSEDTNNSFVIGFKTLNPESNGAAHILEHSVLSGSENFPVKEPFLELVKTSVQTFLNALTYPDRTVYPVASQNLQDHLNLIHVYLDAVFKPLITPMTLAREGWHFHKEKEEEPISIRGVVYNEMKGVYSNFDSEFGDVSIQKLMPDTVYSKDSGGDPKHIPDLTFQKFQKFYTDHYHPSNAIAFLYGNHDNAAKFELLAQYLDEYQSKIVEVPTPTQPKWTEPQTITEFIKSPLAIEQPSLGAVSLMWLLDKATDWKSRLEMTVINRLLLESPSSCLWDELSKAEIGQQIMNLSSGLDLDSTYSYCVFGIGIKEIEVEKIENVESQILEKITNIASKGFDLKDVEAVLAKLEFELRENAPRYYPRGLELSMRIIENYFFDGSIQQGLNLIPLIEQIKAEFNTNPDLFNQLLRQNLLQNQHRSTVVFKPDIEAYNQYHTWEQDRIKAFESSLDDSSRQKLLDDTQALITYNQSQDTEQDLAKIPKLQISDLAKECKWFEPEVTENENFIILHHTSTSKEITYVEIVFPIPELANPSDISLLGTYLSLIPQFDTTNYTYQELKQQIDLNFGALNFETILRKDTNGKDIYLVNISFKCLDNNIEKCLPVLHEILFNLKPSITRIESLLRETKANMVSSIIPANIHFLQSLHQSQYSQSGRLSEELNGISQINHLENAINNPIKALESFNRLSQVFKTKPTISVVDAENSAQKLTDLWSTYFPTPSDSSSLSPFFDLQAENIVIESPVFVNFVSYGGALNLNDSERGAGLVASNLISRNNLWNKVRVLGGAYGGAMQVKYLLNMVIFNSWRDPHLDETISIFSESNSILSKKEFTASQLEAATISTIGKLDSYRDAEDIAGEMLNNHILGWSKEMEQQLRDQVLSCTEENLRNFGERLAENSNDWKIISISSKNAVAKSQILNSSKYRLLQPFKS